MMKKTICLQCEWLWDGLASTCQKEAVVRIVDGKIEQVGPRDSLVPHDGDALLEFPGCTLMPGLIDCHTHLAMDPTLENYLDRMRDGIAEQTLRAVAMMRKDLAAGITACRTLGDREFLDVACRTAIERGTLIGPSLKIATRGIRAPHGHGFVGYPFDGADAIKRAIEENLAAGADFIKIYITGTLKGNGDLPSYLTYDEIRIAIETAHAAKVPIAAHCVGGIGLDWAIDLGLDTAEHVYHITPAQIRKLEGSRTMPVLTPSPLLTESRVHHLPQHLIAGHLAERDMIFRCMADVVASGIPFAVGTDGMHGELAQEVAYLAEMGATSQLALQAATRNAAIASRMDRERGSLECGKDADMLVIRGNPLEDLSALNQVVAVFQRGQKIA